MTEGDFASERKTTIKNLTHAHQVLNSQAFRD